MKLSHCLAGLAAVFLLSVLISMQVRSTITGQVVDAETGKPIENAVVAILWVQWSSLPAEIRVIDDGFREDAEDVSDIQGHFRVPKYSSLRGKIPHFEMAVYKQGYICWTSEKIFPSMETRKGFIPGDGMIIRLEPLEDEHSGEMHAAFVSHIRIGKGLFDHAVEEEIEASREMSGSNREK